MQIIECVPNFSEGRDVRKMEKILQAFREHEQVRLLDHQCDPDHNRLVVTIAGSPEGLRIVLLAAMERALELIDMRVHQGQHPRMGAVDVIPFIPFKGITMDEVVEFSRSLAHEIGERFELPVFLYEAAATSEERRNLAVIRKGGFEAMGDKLKLAEWRPDFGPARVHATAGVTAIGARKPLVAFNVNLLTGRLEVAQEIARRIRHKNGGLHYCKAIGIDLAQEGMVQVSMNLTDFEQTSIYQALELIRMEARRYGVQVGSSEIVGLIPMEALVDSARYYLGLEGFASAQLLESRFLVEN